MISLTPERIKIKTKNPNFLPDVGNVKAPWLAKITLDHNEHRHFQNKIEYKN